MHKHSNNWKGGSLNDAGYKIIYVNGKRIREHRHLMEQHLGQPLKRSEVVHHKNHNRLDNRIENLEILTQSHHASHHAPMMWAKRKDRLDWDEIKRLHGEGLTNIQIARKLGLYRISVQRVVKETLGLVANTTRPPLPKDKIRELHEKGLSTCAIAKVLGIHQGSISSLIRKIGLKANFPPGHPIKKAQDSTDLLIIKLHNDGFSYRTIAKNLGVGYSKVRYAISKFVNHRLLTGSGPRNFATHAHNLRVADESI